MGIKNKFRHSIEYVSQKKHILSSAPDLELLYCRVSRHQGTFMLFRSKKSLPEVGPFTENPLETASEVISSIRLQLIFASNC